MSDDMNKILDVANSLPLPDKDMGTERSRLAAGIAMNQEWDFYVATETDRLLRSMACEDVEGLTVEQLGMKVIGVRHEILALGKAHQHFNACLADSKKEDTETEGGVEEKSDDK